MTSEDFKDQIMARLPYAHYMTKEEHNVFVADLLSYSKFIPPSKLEEVLDEFKMTEFKRRPGIWWFYKRTGSKSKNLLWWYRCDSCGASYTQNSRSCPVCRDNVATIILDKDHGGLDDNVICVQKDCSECSVFGGEGLVRGPECGAWGEYPNDAMCEGCLCFMCCDYEKRYRENPKKMTREKEPMPWIKFMEPVDIRKLIKKKEV